MSSCYHCGLPSQDDFSTHINGVYREFCCPGCRAVAEAIHGGGLQNYYAYRDKPGVKPNQAESNFSVYDLNEVQQEFVLRDREFCTAKLAVGGISCAACAWLIEGHLSKIQGVAGVRVNATTRQAVIRWHEQHIKLSDIFSHLTRIGYQPTPAQNQQAQQQRQKEQRLGLMRLSVAGFGMMQVGMVAIALYAGGEQGITAQWQSLLRWVSLLIATPVILFSAFPFFQSAFRSLKLRQLNMDVPVSLALALAYSASFWATLTNRGEVYFDSVSMFTFFLLLGRYLEMRARHSRAFESENLRQLLPRTAKKHLQGKLEVLPLSALRPGDKVWVDAGAVVPADGEVLTEGAAVDESLITGESEWRVKQKGDNILAGTIAGDTGFSMQVAAVGESTQLAAIENLVAKAELEKPRQVALADKIAGKFVAGLLLVTLVVAAFWWNKNAEQTLWVVLSVLVVTCPCALSLATPAALTAGTNRSRRMGMMILSSHVLEGLSKITHVLLDKTGTLTRGQVSLVQIVNLRSAAHNAVSIAAALEKHSRHPIADAFETKQLQNFAQPEMLVASNVRNFSGSGIEGQIENRVYRFGKPEFCRDILNLNDHLNLSDYSNQCDYATSDKGEELWQYPADGMWQLLADAAGPIAWFKFSDELRHSAAEAVHQLQEQGLFLQLISGDRQQNVEPIARQLSIAKWTATATPGLKLQCLKEYQAKGAKVLMIGDGINDLPVLSAADISVAMGSATQLAQTHADAVLLSGDLCVVPQLMQLARRVQGIIRQNIFWALAYNAAALPAAAAGFIPPWLAAIGMSLSSLVVVCNAMRV